MIEEKKNNDASAPVFLRYEEYSAWEGERWVFAIRLFDEDDIDFSDGFVSCFKNKTYGSDYSLCVVRPGQSGYDDLLRMSLGPSGREGYFHENTLVDMDDSMRKRIAGVVESIENEWRTINSESENERSNRVHRDDFFYKMKAFVGV